MPQSQHNAEPNSNGAPVAWVTGSGAARVGQQIAKRFAAAGYRIVIHANQSIVKAQKFSEELTQSGVQNLIVQGDLANPDFAAKSVGIILEQFGRLDVLVNSAAIWIGNPSTKWSRKMLNINFASIRSEHFFVVSTRG